MKYRLLDGVRSDAAIVCFLGWDTTPACAEHLDAAGLPVLLCWDYRTPTAIPVPPAVEKIYLVAWSLGVWAAEEIAADWPIAEAIAINGTPRPIDADYGIPPAIFAGTLAGLTPQTRQKFARRLCDSPAEWQHYQTLPQRDFSEVKAELAALNDRIQTASARAKIPWSRAWIGARDRIFPPAAQQRYWQDKSRIFAGGHNLFPQLQRWAELWQT